MSLSSLNSIGHTVFELESGNKNVDRQMDGQRNGQKTDNLAMMVIYLPVKFEFDWTNRFRVRIRKRKMQTDVGHINLILGLVTRNPPNKSKNAIKLVL